MSTPKRTMLSWKILRPGPAAPVEMSPKSSGPVAMTTSANHEKAPPVSAWFANHNVKSSTKRGNVTTNTVPRSVPVIVPAPPMRMMAMNSTESSRFHVSGIKRPNTEPRSAPAMPA